MEILRQQKTTLEVLCQKSERLTVEVIPIDKAGWFLIMFNEEQLVATITPPIYFYHNILNFYFKPE